METQLRGYSMTAKPVQIHLADVRRRSLTRQGQTLWTIGDGTDVGSTHWLYAFSDNAVRPSSEITHPLTQTGVLFILPLVGRAQVQLSTYKVEVEAGQLYSTPVRAGDVISIMNTFRKEWINYLLWQMPAVGCGAIVPSIFELDLPLNQLHHPKVNLGAAQIHIGQFAGRVDSTLDLSAPSDVFVFVVEGAFEVQNRLLHARDALSLPCNHELEFEALSNNAIILLLSRGGLHPGRENG